jgi:Rrf2 family protein
MSKVINISDAASLAIHSLAIIASSKDFTNANKIAEITGFSKNHLLKVMRILAKRNYLESERGPNGGFVLKKNPKKITMFEIYELIDGKIEMHSCKMHLNKKCSFDHCVFGNINEKISQEFKSYLQSRTIYDIITTK